MPAEQRHRVVVVGGGFGGLYCAQALRSSPVEVTLIDRRNFHLFQPLLYQVATGALSAANIAAPLRGITRRQKNLRCLLAEVVGFDALARAVITADGVRIPYDTLVLATGSTHHYFGHDQWEEHAPGLKTVEDATEIRRRVLLAFERAERESDPDRRRRMLTFAVIGGGPTGVEMAGAISEVAHFTLKENFRAIDPDTARVILVEGQPRVLPAYHESLSRKAQRYLENDLKVELILDSHVTEITRHYIVVTSDSGEKPPRTIETETLIWAAGVKASPLGKILIESLGADVPVGRGGHVSVEPDCSVPGHPEIFIIGDLASLKDANGKPLPGIAPVAMQQGRYVSTVIHNRVKTIVLPKPFAYWDKGMMATVGRKKAVLEAGRIRLAGTIAWLAWLFIHVLYLAQFSNRLLVLLQWAGNYFTRGRSARLITGEHQAERTAMLDKTSPPDALRVDARNGTGDGNSNGTLEKAKPAAVA